MSDPGPPHLRPAECADLAALAALEVRCFDEPWSALQLAALLARPEGLLLVLEEGELLPAYAAFTLGPGEAELLRLAVAPSHRRGGRASRLLISGLAEVAARGAESCFLEVRADNAAAIALYEGHGFAATGRRPRYYAGGLDAVLMQRRLAPGP